jgi:hypothetical protein
MVTHFFPGKKHTHSDTTPRLEDEHKVWSASWIDYLRILGILKPIVPTPNAL